MTEATVKKERESFSEAREVAKKIEGLTALDV